MRCSTPDRAPDADASTDASIAFRFGISDASVVSTYDQRVALGFKYGYVDGVLGALRNGTDYVLFASGHTQPDAGLCPGTPDTQGAYRLGTALDAITTNYGCKALIEDSPGGPPDGGTLGAFDRDYVGGGPVMRVPNPDGGTPAVIMVYHAEFHWGPQCGAENAACFYGTLGLAFSFDDGVTFEKLGEIVQPNVSRPDWVAAHPERVPRDRRRPVPDRRRQPPRPRPDDGGSGDFLHLRLLRRRRVPGRGRRRASADGQCLGVARASLQSVIDAAFARDHAAAPTLFKKYHQGAFDQPAASGDPNDAVPSGLYTPLESATFEISVLYDRAIDQAIMAAKAGAQIEFRTSSDLRRLATDRDGDGDRRRAGRRRPQVPEPHRRGREHERRRHCALAFLYERRHVEDICLREPASRYRPDALKPRRPRRIVPSQRAGTMGK